jgi:hypothetical protein
MLEKEKKRSTATFLGLSAGSPLKQEKTKQNKKNKFSKAQTRVERLCSHEPTF